MDGGERDAPPFPGGGKKRRATIRVVTAVSGCLLPSFCDPEVNRRVRELVMEGDFVSGPLSRYGYPGASDDPDVGLYEYT